MIFSFSNKQTIKMSKITITIQLEKDDVEDWLADKLADKKINDEDWENIVDMFNDGEYCDDSVYEDILSEIRDYYDTKQEKKELKEKEEKERKEKLKKN